MKSTHLIPASRLLELEKRIAKINKKAEKLEKPPVSLIVGATEQKTVSVGGTLSLRMGTKYTYDAVNVTVIGETPVLNGWKFIATVLHKPAGNEFVMHSDDEHILDSFVFADRVCNHCNKKRPRNATYIVYKESATDFAGASVDTSELMQVGSTCLGDFTGYHSPQAAAKALENVYKLFTDLRTWGGSIAGRTTKKFFLEEYLAFVAYDIRVNGWKSKGQHGDNATAAVAKRHILAAEAGDSHYNLTFSEVAPVTMPADEDYAKAREVIQWVRNNPQEDKEGQDFNKQLQAIYASDDQDISEWEMARAAAGFPNMWRAEKEAKAAESQATQDYVGNIGDKLNLILTVTRKGKGWASDYGWTTPINFTDPNGNHFCWFATGQGADKLEQGKTYQTRATVKRHEIDKYTGDKTTYVNRLTVQAEAASSTPAVDPMELIKAAMK